MNIFTGLEAIVEKDAPMSDYTWYGLGGKADYIVRPRTLEQLSDVAKRCSENGVEMKVLGFGSNLLITDEGVRGVVIKLEGQYFDYIKFEDESVTAGAGVNIGKLVLDCVRKEMSGLESLTGIPGSLGGSVRMNAGGSFGDIGSSVESVTLMDKLGNIYEKSKPELAFDYRSSNITAKFILDAKINLTRSEPDAILKTVKEIWMYKKNSQPLNTKSAGCIFKNPRGLSAGALIDRAGLKGMTTGGAVVSEKHGNFILANKGCKASDVLKLIDKIKASVKEKFNVELQLEIEIW